MSAEERCEMTDLPVSGCAHCKPPAPPYETDDYGTCGRCGKMIYPGQFVRDEGLQTVHTRCRA
jgi:hypothetical protein